MLVGWAARRAFDHCRFTRLWNRPKAAARLSNNRSGWAASTACVAQRILGRLGGSGPSAPRRSHRAGVGCCAPGALQRMQGSTQGLPEPSSPRVPDAVFTTPLSEDAMIGLGIGSMRMCGRREVARPICQGAAVAMDRAGKRRRRQLRSRAAGPRL